MRYPYETKVVDPGPHDECASGVSGLPGVERHHHQQGRERRDVLALRVVWRSVECGQASQGCWRWLSLSVGQPLLNRVCLPEFFLEYLYQRQPLHRGRSARARCERTNRPRRAFAPGAAASPRRGRSRTKDSHRQVLSFRSWESPLAESLPARRNVLAAPRTAEYTRVFEAGGSHRGPEPVQSQPANRVRAGRQQR